MKKDIKSYKAIAGHLTRGAKKRLKGTHRKTTLSFIGVLGITPENAHSYNNRGLSYEKRGKPLKATKDFEKFQRLKQLKNYEVAPRPGSVVIIPEDISRLWKRHEG